MSIARKWFDIHDENKNGLLEREELAKLVYSLLPNGMFHICHHLHKIEKSQKVEELCDQFFSEDQTCLNWRQFISSKAVTSELLTLMENEQWLRNEDDEEETPTGVVNDDSEDEAEEPPVVDPSPIKKNIFVPSISLEALEKNNLQVPTSSAPQSNEGSCSPPGESKRHQQDMLNVKIRMEEIKIREAECYKKERNLQFVMESLRLKEEKLRRYERELHEREMAIAKRETSMAQETVQDVVFSPTNDVSTTPGRTTARRGSITQGVMLSARSSPNSPAKSDPVQNSSPNHERRQSVFGKAINFFKKKDNEEFPSPNSARVSSPTQPLSARSPLAPATARRRDTSDNIK